MSILPWLIDSFERIHMNPHTLRYFNKTLFVTGFVFRKYNVHVWDSIFSHLASKEMADTYNTKMIS